MQRSDFHYDLPPELIAQAPLAERRASRLLVLVTSTEQAFVRMAGATISESAANGLDDVCAAA